VFRIASMTKSFTASMVLALRDRGALRLDDQAAAYVPELAGVQPVAADCPPVTIRHLLTMTAGFPTDDPWGDRQQGLDPAVFAGLLAGGAVRVAWAPGTRFEYSNLGYAVLGKVIEAVTGVRYGQAVRAELLTPLGLQQTGFEAAEFAPDVVARGYQSQPDGWMELQPDPNGAFAPMGGIFSCVRDLAQWVAGFAAAFPARDDQTAPGTPGRHPLSRASRREMQLAQVAITAASPAIRLTSPASISYGFGLFAEDDREFGTVIQHSGGYPGYGSQMRWHPATGLGTVVLANSTYANAGGLASQLLAELLDTAATAGTVASSPGGPVAAAAQPVQHGPFPAPGHAWRETAAAVRTVNTLLQTWDDQVAESLFTPNVAQDRPLQERRADIARLRERIGEFRPDETRAAEYDSPSHCRWWLTGPGGSTIAQIRLAPLRQPLVQQLILALPPATGSALAQTVARLIDAINDGARTWPAGLAAAEAVGTADVLRRLRVAAAWAGPCVIDGVTAGDGDTFVTLRLSGDTGGISLTVRISAEAGALQHAEVALLD
jgi:CubicO group peptidase (beta-lactamase class C family)